MIEANYRMRLAMLIAIAKLGRKAPTVTDMKDVWEAAIAAAPDDWPGELEGGDAIARAQRAIRSIEFPSLRFGEHAGPMAEKVFDATKAAAIEAIAGIGGELEGDELARREDPNVVNVRDRSAGRAAIQALDAGDELERFRRATDNPLFNAADPDELADELAAAAIGRLQKFFKPVPPNAGELEGGRLWKELAQGLARALVAERRGERCPINNQELEAWARV